METYCDTPTHTHTHTHCSALHKTVYNAINQQHIYFHAKVEWKQLVPKHTLPLFSTFLSYSKTKNKNSHSHYMIIFLFYLHKSVVFTQLHSVPDTIKIDTCCNGVNRIFYIQALWNKAFLSLPLSHAHSMHTACTLHTHAHTKAEWSKWQTVTKKSYLKKKEEKKRIYILQNQPLG